MPGQGMQNIPLRIPKKWDAVWYAKHIREVLALADTRNAIEGSGITITGQPGDLATISASDDLQNLLLQSFVLAQPSGFLQFERTLAGEDGVVQIIDGGANSNITVELVDGGITLGKLHELSASGVLGNPVDGVGAVQNINPDGDKSVLHVNGTTIEFGTTDSTYVSDFAEAAQDAVGNILATTSSIALSYLDGVPSISATIVDEYVQDLVATMLVDSNSIDFVYSDTPGTLTANVITANPSGLIGMSAANGTAETPLRSDGRHAIDPAIVPTWTGNHYFVSTQPSIFMQNTTAATGNRTWEFRVGGAGAWNLIACNDDFTSIGAVFQLQPSSGGFAVRLQLDNQELQIGAGQDLRFYHDGTDSWVRNNTGILKLSSGATSIFEVTAARGTFNVPARLKGYTVATLPAGAAGDIAYVTDALAPAFGAAVVGGGAVTVTVYYTGAAWFVG